MLVVPCEGTFAELAGHMRWYFENEGGTSSRLSETFPTVPYAPRNSHGKPVWGFAADPPHP
eukprot:3481764-Prymnesium_polylepis.1